MKANEIETIIKELKKTFILSGEISLDLRKRGLKTQIKTDNTPVTNGDLKVNEIICKKISELTPNVPIVSEETVNLDEKITSKNFWLVDPIDGTNDYINNRDEFTLNAALILNSQPEAGIIYAPAKKRLFYSYGMGNAYEDSNNITLKLNCEKKSKANQVIALSNTNKPSEEIIKIHKKYSVTEFVNMRSSLKFCVIASGEFDLYAANARAKEWDIAAGHAIIKHANGIVTDQNNEIFKYGKDKYKNTSLLVLRSKNLLK